MTPEQRKELRGALRSADYHFQQRFGADVPGQLSGRQFMGDKEIELETWRAVVRAIKTLDDAYEGHQRLRGAAERAVETLEAKR